jgi:hypothetical protein
MGTEISAAQGAAARFFPKMR